MPDTFELTLSLLQNGKPYPGLAPYVRRITVGATQEFDAVLEGQSGDVVLPIERLEDISFLFVQGSQPQLVNLGAIRLGAGGFVLLWNAQNTIELINNDGPFDARIIGLAGGT